MSTAQSAHYIVGGVGTWHFARSRGRRPEPIPGMEPGRWRVVRARGLPASERAWWYVERENCHGSMWFPTWREAQDYADRMARTREVVLPRPNFEDEVAERTALSPTKYRKVKGWLFPQHQVALVYEPESDVAIYYLVDDTNQQQRALVLRREEWVDVASALFALAEQEGCNESP